MLIPLKNLLARLPGFSGWHQYRNVKGRVDAIINQLDDDEPGWAEGFTPDARAAFAAGLWRAEQYRAWDDWSLCPQAIAWVAELAFKHRMQHIVEFGAGYSTLLLTEFLSRLNLPIQMQSFEHQIEFSELIAAKLSGANRTKLHCLPLVQMDTDDANAFPDSSDPWLFFKRAHMVKPEFYGETRLQHGFYQLEPSLWQGTPPIDLIILDGPNGSGRSLCFPLLKSHIKYPAHLIIDDYKDYPFLDDLGRTFEWKVVKERQIRNNEFILIQIIDKR